MLEVVRLGEPDDGVLGELTGEVRGVSGEVVRMAMAETGVVRERLTCEPEVPDGAVRDDYR